jgi:Rv0078B-related antitoxin
MHVMDLLRGAIDLFDVAEALTRQRLHRQNPGWTLEQLDAAVTEWFLQRPDAPEGDFSGGKVVPWPRNKTI